MTAINNQTEKEYRDKQTQFGHITSAKDLLSWLKSTYAVNSHKEKRYHKIAADYLNSTSSYSVLEIAAGVGDFTMFCTKLFPQHSYTVNELSELQLTSNIQSVADFFEVNKLPQVSCGAIESLKLDSNTFDLVFVKASLHHFENPQKAMHTISSFLKSGGKVIFFEDPVCLDIPIYTGWRKKNNCVSERELGINENIYTLHEYLSFGKEFDHVGYYLDTELVAEYDRQQQNRKTFKKLIGLCVRKFPLFFKALMIWRFTSPMIFVFTKR